MANTKSIGLVSSSSQYLSILDANQTGLDLSGDCTFEFWLKRDDTNAFYPFAKHNPTTGNRGYVMTVNSDSTISFQYSQYGSGTNTGFKTDNAVVGSTGTWYHVAVTTDVSLKDIKFYINGSEVDATSFSSYATSINNTIEPLYIGAYKGASGFLNGKMDEIIVWNDIRTSTEISGSYNSGDGKIYVGTETNMVAYWRLEDDLLDETSNDNDLTNNNSATYSTDVPFSGSTPTASFIPQVSIF